VELSRKSDANRRQRSHGSRRKINVLLRLDWLRNPVCDAIHQSAEVGRARGDTSSSRSERAFLARIDSGLMGHVQRSETRRQNSWTVACRAQRNQLAVPVPSRRVNRTNPDIPVPCTVRCAGFFLLYQHGYMKILTVTSNPSSNSLNCPDLDFFGK
jgi:hypothetical protein